jgi:fucose 4-O-acetylase-like acetyltransferase
MNQKRFEWINNVRGVMILLVAFGHIITGNYVDNTFNSIMRMPVFFMISGFLFSFKPQPDYFKHKATKLLIPYFIYLVPILALQMYLEDKEITEYIARLLLGGTYLYSWTGVFWFVTCLFFTQQIFNLFRTWHNQKIGFVMLGFLVLAYLNDAFLPLSLPMSINVCLYSCPLFFIGFMFKKYIFETTIPIMIPITLLATIFVLSTFLLEGLYIDMKHVNYGIPIINFVLSIICAFCCVVVFKEWNKFHIFSLFGRASLSILYLHLPIYYMLLIVFPNLSQWYILIIAIIVPTGVYYLLKKNSWTTKYMLGEN